MNRRWIVGRGKLGHSAESVSRGLAATLFPIFLLALSCGSTSVSETGAPAPVDASTAIGFFSVAQVERGRQSYRETCSECHKTSQFQGSEFEWRWRRQSAWELYRTISTTMPETRPAGLAAETYADIVAYLLSLNEYEMGSIELGVDRESLAAIPLGAGVEKSRASRE